MVKDIVKRGTVLLLSAAMIFGGVGQMTKIETHATEVTGAGINVTKVNGISDDFIMGMDVSSYVSVTKSGVVFKDYDGKALDDKGFYNLLKSCGVNYIRIRVWNDPYDADGNGYGGGNCDIENAAVIGKLATNAGMKVLIDFHYSDFWADPARQLVPKEWEGYTVDQKVTAIYDYTKESLTYLKNQGVNIGMVQVGNETTGAFCGETNWTSICKMFNSGCEAIRDVDSNILIAIHFTNPESTDYNWYASTLSKNNVDYDVFASSYYPAWHGTISNLVTKLKTVVNNYGKKVMVVETSYPHTSEDYDKSGNDILSTQLNGFPEVSVQGQADYMASLIKSVAGIGDSAIGICYWEGAWAAVGNNWSSNVKLWEKYGSGWATKYANEYDSAHVGGQTGGPTTDNQCFFDSNGKALASLNVFKYVRTGATTSGGEIATTDDVTTETTTKKPAVTTTTENQETSGEDTTTTNNNNETNSETTNDATDETTVEQNDNQETTSEETSEVVDETTEKETEKSNEAVEDSMDADKETTSEDVNKDKNSSTMIIIIVLIMIIVVGVAAAFFVIKNRSKNNEDNSDRREDNQQ